MPQLNNLWSLRKDICMEQSRTKSTLINTSFAVMARFVSMGFGFLQKTIFIRTLGMSYTGISGLFTDILTILSLAELGISSAIAYSLYKPIAENDYKRIAQLMNFFKKAYTLIAVTIFTLGLCLVPVIQYIVKDVPDITESIQLIFVLYIANTAVTYLLVYKNTLLVAAQKQYIVSNIQMIFTVISIVVQCVILLIFRDFMLYLVLQIVFSLLQNITINLVATKKYPQLKEFSREKISKEDRKRLFKDIKALMLYKIANVITTGTDSTIISSALGTSQVGILGNYRTIQGYATSIIAQFYNSINPSLGNLAAVEGKERQYRIFKKLDFGTFWLTCFCATAFWTLFNPFIYIWLGSEEWLLSSITVVVFVMDFFLSNVLHSVGAFRIANGLFVQTKYLALTRAIINLIISIALVKPLGILGVLLGTVLSCVVTQLWYEPMILYREVFQKSVLEYYLRLVVYILITMGCCVTISGIMQLFSVSNPWVELLIRAGLCVIIVNVVVSVLFYNREEYHECLILIRKVLNSMFRKIVPKKVS